MRVYQLLLFLIILSFSCKRGYQGGEETNTSPYSRQSEPTEIRTEPESISEPEQESSDNDGSVDITDLFQKLEKSVFMIVVRAGEERIQGSAFLIAPDIGISNYHLLREDLEEIKVFIQGEWFDVIELIDGSETEALDYFTFRIEGFRGTPLKIAARRPKIGKDVFAIGSPQGLSNSLTKGTVSGYRGDLLQFDATIDHGSSGGPLFNYQGEVVGITSAGVNSGKELNFAVDIQQIDLSKYTSRR